MSYILLKEFCKGTTVGRETKCDVLNQFESALNKFKIWDFVLSGDDCWGYLTTRCLFSHCKQSVAQKGKPFIVVLISCHAFNS